jgi:receptor protein-tyrosine kinase
MEPTELLRVLWRQKVIALAALAVVLATAFAAVKLQQPQYDSFSTLALSPDNPDDAVVLYNTIDVIVPVYAEAVESTSTLQRSEQSLGHPIGSVKVRTFERTPIIRIVVRHPVPAQAQAGARALTTALLDRERVEEVGIPGMSLREVNSPALPTEPAVPQTKLTLIVAGIIGLGLAIGAALLRENLTRKVESGEILAEVAGVPLFAEIPYEPAVPKAQSLGGLVSDVRLRALAESFRDLRTNLQYSVGDFHSLLLTSPEGRHGKTTVAVGTAATLARSGARTLLVDGDLRRGRVAEMLGLPRSPGFIDVLRGDSHEEIVQDSSIEGLQVLTGGAFTEDPTELLESRFFTVLHRLHQGYDAVVIDATPLLPINDSRIMARYATATVLVVNAETATRRQVRTATERLNLIGVRLTAVVFNLARVRRRSSYYAYLETPPGVEAETTTA